ncbi:hypothetical protein V2E24_02905 [Mycoplasmopsis ciconiae]|uniref:Lipoprotein associated domain-containing protein n=1 Tax=Mycoplasmopsis ciconiae TaxID=561067 RepID=A0ABU7MLX9_9BACT|nr:hypothetical protein [Mycoplasmopsis ciconiae]
MNKNKKIVILSSSLAGIGLAAGALAVSCYDSSKENEAITQKTTDEQLKNISVTISQQSIDPKTGKINGLVPVINYVTGKNGFDKSKFEASIVSSKFKLDDKNEPVFNTDSNRYTYTVTVLVKSKPEASSNGQVFEQTEDFDVLGPVVSADETPQAIAKAKENQARLEAERKEAEQKAQEAAEKAKAEEEMRAKQAEAEKAQRLEAEKEAVRNNLQNVVKAPVVAFNGDRAQYYLPNELSTAQKAFEFENAHILFKAPSNINASVELLELKLNATAEEKNVLDVVFQYTSTQFPEIKVTRTVQMGGFKSLSTYNEQMQSAFHKEFEAAKQQILDNVKFDYTDKANTKLSNLNVANVTVTNGDVAPAVVKVLSIAPKADQNYMSNTAVVTYEIVSSNADMADVKSSQMSVEISGFMTAEAEYYADMNYLDNALTELVLVPVTQSAENQTNPSTAREAYNLYNRTENYKDIMSVAYNYNKDSKIEFADNSTLASTQEVDNLKDYANVEFKPLEVYTLVTHPDLILVKFELSKGLAKLTGTKILAGFTKYVAPEVKPEEPSKETTETPQEKPVVTVDQKAEEAKRLAALTLNATPVYSETAKYYVQSTFNQIAKNAQVLPSVFKTEYDNEVSAAESFDYNASNNSILTTSLAVESSGEVSAKVQSVQLVADDAKGTLAVSATVVSTKPGMEDVTATLTLSNALSGFLTTENANKIKRNVSLLMQSYSIVKSTDSTNSIKFTLNNQDLAPVTNVSVFDTFNPSKVIDGKEVKLYSLFNNVNGFESNFQTNQPATKVDGSEIVTRLNELVPGIELKKVELKYLAVDVTPNVQNGEVNVGNLVAALIPGLGTSEYSIPVTQGQELSAKGDVIVQNQYVSDSVIRYERLSGFLNNEEAQKIKENWILTANDIISQTTQNNRVISFVNIANNTLTDVKAQTLISEAVTTKEGLTKEQKDEILSHYSYLVGENAPYSPFYIPSQYQSKNPQTGARESHALDPQTPYGQNYVFKLKALAAEISDEETGVVKLTFTLVNPYHPDWSINDIQNVTIKGFETQKQRDTANKAKEQQLLSKLAELLTKDAQSNQRIFVDYDYTPNKSTTQVAQARTQQNYTNFKATLVSGLTDGEFTAKLKELISKNSDEYSKFEDLLNYPISSVKFTPVQNTIMPVPGTSGEAQLTFEISRVLDNLPTIQAQNDRTIKASVTGVVVKGFSISAEEEKARLSKLKVQFQYETQGYVSTDQYNNLDSLSGQENVTKDQLASFAPLRNISILKAQQIKDAFSEIANYKDEQANVVITAVALTTPNDKSSRNLTISYKIVSTKPGMITEVNGKQVPVETETMTATFGGFKTLAESEKEKLVDSLNQQLPNVTVNYTGAGDKAKNAVTPVKVVAMDDVTSLFNATLPTQPTSTENTESNQQSQYTLSVKSVALPQGADAANNDSVVVTVEIASNENPEVKATKEISVNGFATLKQQVTTQVNAVAAKAKQITASIKTPTEYDLSQFLPSVANDVIIRHIENIEVTLKSQESDLLANVKGVFVPGSIEVDNQKGTISFEYKLVSTNEELTGSNQVSSRVLTGTMTLMTQEAYNAAYKKEVERLNTVAAMSQINGQSANLVLGVDPKFASVTNLTSDMLISNSTMLYKDKNVNAWDMINFLDTNFANTNKVSLRVVSVEKGFKPNSAIVSFVLVSNNPEQMGMMDYVVNKKSELGFSGVTSKQFTSEVVLYNLMTNEQLTKEEQIKRQMIESALASTTLVSTQLPKETRDIIDYLSLVATDTGVKPYNNVFEQGSGVIDNLVKEDLTLENPTDLSVVASGPAKDIEYSQPTFSEITVKEVKSVQFSKESKFAQEGFFVASYQIVNNELAPLLQNLNTTTDLYVVLTLGNKFVSNNVTSPKFLVKLTGFKSQLVANQAQAQEIQRELQLLNAATQYANISNAVLNDNAVISLENIKNPQKLAEMVKFNVLSNGSLANANAFANASEFNFGDQANENYKPIYQMALGLNTYTNDAFAKLTAGAKEIYDKNRDSNLSDEDKKAKMDKQLSYYWQNISPSLAGIIKRTSQDHVNFALAMSVEEVVNTINSFMTNGENSSLVEQYNRAGSDESNKNFVASLIVDAAFKNSSASFQSPLLVNFKVVDAHVLSSDQYQVSFVLNYVVETYDKYDQEKPSVSIPTRTVFLNQPTKAGLDLLKGVSNAIANASAEFNSSVNFDMTAAAAVVNYNKETATAEEKAKIAQYTEGTLTTSKEFEQYLDQLQVVITSVVDDKYNGRIGVNYRVVTKATEGPLADSKYKETAEKFAWISQFDYVAPAAEEVQPEAAVAEPTPGTSTAASEGTDSSAAPAAAQPQPANTGETSATTGSDAGQTE